MFWQLLEDRDYVLGPYVVQAARVNPHVRQWLWLQTHVEVAWALFECNGDHEWAIGVDGTLYDVHRDGTSIHLQHTVQTIGDLVLRAAG